MVRIRQAMEIEPTVGIRARCFRGGEVLVVVDVLDGGEGKKKPCKSWMPPTTGKGVRW